jgi:hypothetical protein
MPVHITHRISRIPRIVVPGKFGSRPLVRWGLPLVGLVLLCSCSSVPRTETVPPQPAPASAPGADKNKVDRRKSIPVRPTRSASVSPVVPAARVTPSTPTPPRLSAETPPAPPSRAEQIRRLVRTGVLVEADRDSLVFSTSRTIQTAPGGLFEDAIVLNRLRGQLKKIPGLPESVAGTATVQGARAHLRIDTNLSAELAARAIEAALSTDGVEVVQVSSSPAARL